MKTKKEITMWAIWSPYSKKFVASGFTLADAWQLFRFELEGSGQGLNVSSKNLKLEGYRAVKGKFVWEEK